MSVAAAPRPRVLHLILSRPPDQDQLYLIQFFRRDTGVRKLSFRYSQPEGAEAMSPATLAAEIRSAAGKGIGVLVVDPVDAPEVRDALREADSRGVVIVLMHTPIPSSVESRPWPCLLLVGFDEAGRRIVAGVREDLGVLQVAPERPVLVVTRHPADIHTEDRMRSLLKALEEAGQPFEVISYSGAEAEARAAIETFLEQRPEVAAILAEEDYGLGAAYLVRRERAERGLPDLPYAGYAANDARLEFLVRNKASVVADRHIEGLVRRIVWTAADLLEGKPQPALIELPMPVLRNSGNVAPPARGRPVLGAGSETGPGQRVPGPDPPDSSGSIRLPRTPERPASPVPPPP